MKAELPKLKWEVTRENWERAVTESSGACVHADAIKVQYPEYTAVKVNVATIQVSDKERGVRYLYLTPSSVADLLIAFDQGWSWAEEQFPKKFRINQPVKIIPIIRSASDLKINTERQTARLAELETKEQSGEPLTSDDKRTLKRLRNPKKHRPRPTVYGPSKAVKSDVVQGSPGRYPKYTANILNERNRRFGAKSAQPGEVFKKAVEAAAKEAVEADRATRTVVE